MIAIRDVLFANWRRTALVAVLLLAAVLGGAAATGALGAPAVTGVENRFAGVNDTSTAIESTVGIRNPNPIGVTLGGVTVDYAVGMNGIRMAEGVKRGVAVDSGESNLTLATRMDNEKIPGWWVSHIENGEHTDLAVHAQVRSKTVGESFDAPTITRDVDTDLISQFNSTETRAIRSERPLAPDPIMYVNETSARWGAVGDNRTDIELTFEVYNPNSHPLTVSELGYDVSMNDVAVGNGSTERGYVIPPNSRETVEATVTIRNEKLDEWWVSHLERNQVTDLRIDFHAKLDVGQLGTVRVPLDPLTYNRTIETDIFGTKPADEPTATPESSGEGDSSDGGASTAAEPTDDGSTATGTESTSDGLLGGDDAETSSPTAAPTPDDSGETTTSESATGTETEGGTADGTSTGATTAGTTSAGTSTAEATSTGTAPAETTTDGGGLLDL